MLSLVACDSTCGTEAVKLQSAFRQRRHSARSRNTVSLSDSLCPQSSQWHLKLQTAIVQKALHQAKKNRLCQTVNVNAKSVHDAIRQKLKPMSNVLLHHIRGKNVTSAVTASSSLSCAKQVWSRSAAARHTLHIHEPLLANESFRIKALAQFQECMKYRLHRASPKFWLRCGKISQAKQCETTSELFGKEPCLTPGTQAFLLHLCRPSDTQPSASAGGAFCHVSTCLC